MEAPAPAHLLDACWAFGRSVPACARSLGTMLSSQCAETGWQHDRAGDVAQCTKGGRQRCVSATEVPSLARRGMPLGRGMPLHAPHAGTICVACCAGALQPSSSTNQASICTLLYSLSQKCIDAAVQVSKQHKRLVRDVGCGPIACAPLKDSALYKCGPWESAPKCVFVFKRLL
jgi:hypothetical protein